MSWTTVNKPTTSNWSVTNPAGRTQYDQANITYDDPTMFFDGINPNAWTNVARPSPIFNYVGRASGLLMPLTFRTSVLGSSWTNVPKPTI